MHDYGRCALVARKPPSTGSITPLSIALVRSSHDLIAMVSPRDKSENTKMMHETRNSKAYDVVISLLPAQNRRIWPRNVHFTLTKMTIINQTQLTPSCFGYNKAALSAPSLVGELSVTLRDLPYTLFGGLASNAAPRRYNLRIVHSSPELGLCLHG